MNARSAEALEFFTREEVERARRYHVPLYGAALGDLLLSFGLLGVLALGPPGDRVGRALGGVPWWQGTLAWTAVVIGLSFVLRLPLGYWRGFVREKRWGFSTQTLMGWLADKMKGLAVSSVLASVTMLGFVGLARALPRTWPFAVAPSGVVLILVLSFIGPVVLEPLFNRFSPVADASLADELRRLSDRAGVPVREVLVADASRRTMKENAYVSGLGRTRRVVVFDTLLARGELGEVRLVVAHELGHRRLRHVAKGMALGLAGMVVGVAVLWGLLESHAVLGEVGARAAGDPRVVPFVFFAGAVLSCVGLPVESWVSRRWERAADRFSLELTGDPAVFERAHRTLAVGNLSDLDPPRLVYVFAFTHPSAPERIAAARTLAMRLGLPTTA